ncbi:hypothetical protein SAMN04487981_102521 [Streptomyces sp. cf386]|uniref:hypothetical protein n=1 Tax=Streptomyces sp. cf386 TaxID=1761904 RepID=UPI0008844D01|nr:hypothetical protein [Streptomyces sp. cf386]SDM76947.1 hypothetical protein SAMN04487981_102521 [Streptomyces sp. cf386]
MAESRIVTAEQAWTFFGSVAADGMHTEAERLARVLQERFEEAERRPKYHRMPGEAP